MYHNGPKLHSKVHAQNASECNFFPEVLSDL